MSENSSSSPRSWILVTTVFAVASASSAHAGGRACQLRQWAEAAVAPDAATSAAAIAALRRAGPEGLEAVIDAHPEQLEARRRAPIHIEPGEPDAQWERLTAALDAVGMARDTYAAQLYWYTDWEDAAAAARASARPILSLRLMGNLTDEYSCANSRFFRTALYANESISQYLRDHFVLHWKSVRPVPRVSIDFGDGRKLERTLTGNSIHYVLDAEGRVIDAFPGLYGPGAFLKGLKAAETLAATLARAEAAERDSMLSQFHESRAATILANWSSDLQSSGVTAPPPVKADTDAPNALAAARAAVSKSIAEIGALREILPTAEFLKGSTDDAMWVRIASAHRDDARLDEASLRFMREKSAVLRRARHIASGGQSCAPPMAERFEAAMVLDTVRNEYLFRREIHDWLAVGGPAPDVETLNARVYAELFLTPDSDPWLGLMPADVYTALADDGVTRTPAAPAHPVQ